MQTLLRELINQYFPSPEDIPPQIAAFLQDLDKKLSTLAEDGHQAENFKDPLLDEARQQTSEKTGVLANITQTIIKEIAALDQASLVLEQLT